ncbi:MAG TPA: hypothetical protein VFW03_18220 [Gemmatimonadaceae bacterium]|nr:hypothetical protein [Gemmatimonadaceae bacterium]
MPAVPAEVADILMAVATIPTPVAKIPIQVSPVLATFADVLAALLARVVVADLSRVLPQLATILPDFMVVAAKLAGVMMDLTPVRAQLVRFAMRHARVQRRVRGVETLCAYDVRTSNEQGRGNGSHSEIAHGISQRQYRALAAMACAAYSTAPRSRTLRREANAFARGNFCR